MIVWYLTVVVLSLLAVMVLREVRAEIWDRSIGREREADWDSELLRKLCDRVVQIHEETREEIMRCDAAVVSEMLNREMSLTDWCRFQAGDGEK